METPQANEILALQQELNEIQTKAVEGTASAEEMRRGIDIIRLLRRTNTGPAARQRTKKPNQPVDVIKLLDNTN